MTDELRRRNNPDLAEVIRARRLTPIDPHADAPRASPP